MKTLKHLLSLCAFILLGTSSFAQNSNLDALMRSRNEYYFSVEVSDKAEAKALNRIVSVDKMTGNTVVCYANSSQYDLLVAAGYKPTLLTPPSMLEEAEMWDGGNRATYDWTSYPTYSAYEQMMNEYDTYANCTVTTLGTLSSGRKIMVARINNGHPEGKPRFLYSSTIHGDETTGWIMMLRLIDYLLTSDDSRVANLLDNIDIFICPLANPDGTYYGGNNTVNGARRYNANGVDMNRNYPDFDDGAHPDGNAYASETQWFMELAEQYLFTMSANYHGGAEVMNYPWDTYQPLHVDDSWWQYISREYANTCHTISSNYMTDENNGITNGYAWYTISGSRQDYMNYYAQCREITIECSSTKSPSGSQLPTFWNYNQESILLLLEECTYGVHGVVTDSQTGLPIEGVRVQVLNHDQDYANVSSHEVGDYHRPIKAGTYTIQYTKDGYCPETRTVTVADGQRVNVDVQLTPGDCIIADFSADKTFVGAGQTVTFTDLSFGNIASWNWQFEGGTPATSTQQNPTVTYNTSGVYTVTLTVQGNTESATETKTGYITVVDQEINMSNTTIHTCNALFYDHRGPNQNYNNNQNITTVIYPDDDNATLQVTFSDFATESGYDFLNIYDGNTATDSNLIGQYSGTDSPGTVTASTPGGALTFKFTSDRYENAAGWVAMIKCLTDEPEPLEVTISDNAQGCVTEGNSVQLTANATGGTGNYTYSWTPATNLDDPTSPNPTATPTEETTYTVTVSDGNSTATASIVVCFIDGMTDNATSHSKIYPNPATDEICIESNFIGTSNYRIFNNLGQIISSGHFSGKTIIGTDKIGKGLFFIEVNNDNNVSTHKTIVQ